MSFGVVRLEHSAMITRGFYFRNLLPIGAAMAITLATGNAVYLFLPVGFIQMLKAFTPGGWLLFLHTLPPHPTLIGMAVLPIA